MMMTIRLPADTGEIFTPDSFSRVVGKDVPFRFDSKPFIGKLVNARVGPGGMYVDLTFGFVHEVSPEEN